MLVVSPTQRTMAAPAKQTGPTTWTVLVGSEAELQPVQHGQAGVWQIMKFYPDNLTINVGDTIDFKLNSPEPHTVLFLAPGAQAPQIFVPQQNPSGPPSIYANPEVFLPSGGPTFDGTATSGAGQLGGEPTNPKEYKLTFTKAGSFGYFCSFHSGLNPQTNKIEGMTGNVVVQDASTAYPKSVDQVNSDAQAAIATDQANVVKGEPDVQKLAQATRPGPNGTTIYQVNVGGMNMAVGADYMRFYPSELTVHAGDTVEWVWHGLPHTVTFASGGKEPDLILPQPQPNGPPKLLSNPQIAFPVGGKVYNGAGLFNSGTPLNPTNADGSPVTYMLTFSKPGKYEYICSFHDQEGMVGHITVLAAMSSGGQAGGSQPMMPQTGSGSADGFGWLLALALLTISLGVALKRRIVAQVG